MSADPPIFYRILAGCFSGLPERAFLAPAADGLAEFEHVGSPMALVGRLKRSRPVMLILPTADRRGASVAPLAARCAAESPDIRQVLVATRKAGAGYGLRGALRTDAALVSVASSEELRAVIATTLGQRALWPAERAQMELVLARATPPLVRAALTQATIFAHEDLTTDLLAARLEHSRYKLFRDLRGSGSPNARELILWGRLVRASIVAWRERASLFALSRVAGFPSPRELVRACHSLLGVAHVEPRLLTPSCVARALRSRLDQPPPAAGEPPPVRVLARLPHRTRSPDPPPAA